MHLNISESVASPTKFRMLRNFLKRFYLFIFRQKGREEEREGEKHQCVVASLVAPDWGPGLEPRHVP